MPRTVAKGLIQINASLDIYLRKSQHVWPVGVFDRLDDPYELTREVAQQLGLAIERMQATQQAIAEQLDCVEQALAQCS